MNRIVDRRLHLAKHAVLSVAGIALLLFVCAAPARATLGDAESAARDQFAVAVRMRTMLEGYLEKDRSLADYAKTLDAYQKVYTLSARADETPPALIAEAELYEEMGRLFDPKYYDVALKTYRTVIGEYPTSRFRTVAFFGIAQIQRSDLNKPLDAEATYQEFLKKYPRSEKASDARKALKEIVDAQAAIAPPAPVPPPRVASAVAQAAAAVVPVADPLAVSGTRVEPRELQGRLASVKGIDATNGKDAARIILALDNTIDFQSARISSPDRIYFNISRATLTPKAAPKQFDADDGLLRSVRLAQNKPDVVRLVLDAPAAKDYTAYLLSNPYRLVIEVFAKPMPPAAREVAAATSAPVGVTASANSAGDRVVADAAPVSDSSRPKTKPVLLERRNDLPPPPLVPQSAPKPTSDGDTSLTRVLGLKIRRIVIDPGHGGHDTGTIGPHGLLEKDLCLDVALRLGKLIQQKLPGAEVVYTREDDTFVPLEERTRIANDAKADLFVSIHANSSHDVSTRGVETYYLNFSTSGDSMEVAARENALSQESLHDLQDLIKKIARNDKIEESRELAGDVQQSLSHRLQSVSPSEHDRGVKKAPFVVLIGADMPSVLSEISFVSNPADEKLLKKTDQRQRIADGLYRGIASYLQSLNSLSFNAQPTAGSASALADNRLDATTASAK